MDLDFEFLIDDDFKVFISGEFPRTLDIDDSRITIIDSCSVIIEKNGKTIGMTAGEFYDFITEISWGLR